jgi:putative ABC transport system permease protein
MAILRLALKSLLNRRYTALLMLFSITLSVTLLLGVERLRTESRASFANTVSGTDLVVGARSGAINLLLYSIFRIGDATNNISWKSYRHFDEHPLVDWTIPLSLGDSHQGYRVLGTNNNYFLHYRYAGTRSLEFNAGSQFQGVYEAVLGFEVAQKLGYNLGQEIVIAHGAGKVSFEKHEDKPFRVIGILEPTGTPVDRTVHVPLEGIEAIHVDWMAGRPIPGHTLSADEALQRDLTPKAITAFMVGLKSRIATFRVQREINDYRKEPLLAILPGVALQQLWEMMSVAENALVIVSWMVVAVGFAGMLSVMLAGLNERRREMAILRSVGARPAHILLLVSGESFLLILAGLALGVSLTYLWIWLLQPVMTSRFGIQLAIGSLSLHEWQLIGAILLAGLLVGLVPGLQAYRNSLSDGMSIRL